MNKSRITINIDKDLEKKLRKIQATMIAETIGPYSFSGTIEYVLNQGLENLSKTKK